MTLFGFRPKEDARPDDTAWPPATWPMPDGVELHGQVVTLRPIVAADHEELRRALDFPQVWAHLPTPNPPDAEVMGELVDSLRRRGFQPWVLRLSAPFETGVRRAARRVRSSAGRRTSRSLPADARLEIGNTAYTPAVWGTAVNAEAKLLLLGYAFEGLSMGRVQLKTDIRNVRSQRAIAGLGATYEGTLRRYQRRADGTVRDTVLFSITAEDWPAYARTPPRSTPAVVGSIDHVARTTTRTAPLELLGLSGLLTQDERDIQAAVRADGRRARPAPRRRVVRGRDAAGARPGPGVRQARRARACTSRATAAPG